MTDAASPQGAVVYEIHEELAGALLPTHDYGVTGSCATGGGIEPASLVAQGGSGRGFALGAGLGAGVGYLYSPSPPDEGRSTWWGVRVATGLDIDLGYGRVDTGLPDVSGELCARLRAEGVSVQYEGSTVLIGRLSAKLGVQVGIGGGERDGPWRGLVLGAALVPAMTYIDPFAADGSVDGSVVGAELTLDFASLERGTMRESGKRASVFLLLPPEDRGPLVVTLGFGVVWP